MYLKVFNNLCGIQHFPSCLYLKKIKKGREPVVELFESHNCIYVCTVAAITSELRRIEQEPLRQLTWNDPSLNLNKLRIIRFIM